MHPLETVIQSLTQWLASPDKLLAQPTDMAVVFNKPIELKQNVKKKNPEKTQMEKPIKKKRKQITMMR